MSTNLFIDPNLTQDDIPEEDLQTLARLAGEKVRAESRRLREAGLYPEKPKAPSQDVVPAEDTLAR